MDEAFVALATLVRGTAPVPALAPATFPLAPAPSDADPVVAFAHGTFVRDLALMRLATLEAFERGLAGMLRGLADEVLAREILQSPANVGALVERALAEFAEHEPVEIALCASDAERATFPLPVRVDPALGQGDVVVVVRDGAFESLFAFRLETLLANSARSCAE